jgi:MEDS: MEthanogen/methylotroph, DcmR Sensory domain
MAETHVKPPSQPSGGGPMHAVRFYRDSDGLSRIVADFLSRSLLAAEPALVIATPAHAAAIEAQLRALGADVDHHAAEGRLVVLDAETLLSEFMVDGLPDAARFRAAITPVLAGMSADTARPTIRAYGEMVDVLWRGGHTAAAIRLETLWNMLARSRPLSLLCAYAIGNFYKTGAVDDICDQHSHVVGDMGETILVT